MFRVEVAIGVTIKLTKRVTIRETIKGRAMKGYYKGLL